MGKRQEHRHSIKEDMQMANWHVKIRTSWAIGEMQIKTTVRYYHMSIIMAKFCQSTKYLKGWRKNGSHKHMCTPVADSYLCMATPIQYCEVINLQLK